MHYNAVGMESNFNDLKTKQDECTKDLNSNNLNKYTMNLETEIYQILKKHRLSLKKREEVIVDLLDFIKKRDKAMNYSQCCTELPNKMVIELSDEEMQIVSTDELIQMEKEAMEFDGFEGWIVRGKAAILK